MIATPERAAALQYQAGMPAPLIVATGRGALASRIAEIAAAHEITIVSDPDLAEDLVELEPGEWLPEQLWEAVAAILAFFGTVGKAS